MPASVETVRPNNEIIAAADLPAFQTKLLGWFAEAKRDLDWRRTRDAYRVWISEIMLQQTRVAAVLPYYRRFLARFPTMDALARARQDAVLRSWAGLGYYSRARNLHRAAKQIVAKHDGEFPRRIEDALGLPGIGPYTAAAVLSIAYGEAHAVVDGNVARVLARLGAIRGDLRRPKRWRELAAAANALLPAQAAPAASAPTTGAGDWNQAMMELGATLCTPRAPQCAACPVAHWCRAHALGIALRLPAPRRKPKAGAPDALGGRFARPARPHNARAAKKPTQRLVFEPVAIPCDRIRKTATRKAGALSAIGLWHYGGARAFAAGATHRHLPQNPAGAVSGARRQIAANWPFNERDSAHTAPGRDRAPAHLQRHKKDRRSRPARARDDNVMLKHPRGCADY